MKCKVCHFGNPADGKYCRECGSRLDRSYGFFGEQTRFSAIHRDGCGQDPAKRIGDGKRRFDGNGELKRVTVLFADLCDYSRMAERLDPEEVKGIPRIPLGLTRMEPRLTNPPGLINGRPGEPFAAGLS